MLLKAMQVLIMLKFKILLFTLKSRNIDDVFQSIYTTIISNIQKSLGKSSGWITDSVIERKGLIYVQNTDDNECFKWCLVRYLNPADHDPTLDFKDIKLQVKTRDIHKIVKKIPSALAFLVMKITKNIQFMY